MAESVGAAFVTRAVAGTGCKASGITADAVNALAAALRCCYGLFCKLVKSEERSANEGPTCVARLAKMARIRVVNFIVLELKGGLS